MSFIDQPLCPPDCFLRGVRHGHAIDPMDAARTYYKAAQREAPMSDEPLGPITWDDQVKLVALVHAAVRMADLGVRPLRVWLLTATCSEHGEIEDERAIDISQVPGTAETILCALCAVRRWGNPRITVSRVVLVRG